MRKSGGMWEGQTEDTVMGGLYRWSEFQEVPWWGMEDGGLVCIGKDGESKGAGRGGTHAYTHAHTHVHMHAHTPK